MNPALKTRVEQALEAQHAAERRQLAMESDAVRLAGEPRRSVLHRLLRQTSEVAQLAADTSSDAQRSLLEAHCADTSILLALLAARP